MGPSLPVNRSLMCSDPQEATSLRLLSNWVTPYLNDPRDVIFIEKFLLILVLIVPSSSAFFLIDFPWWSAASYWLMIIYFLGPYLLMLHLTCHRKLFNPQWKFANRFISWVLGPFFGQIPEGFFAHHISMHHSENNLQNDLSSTLRFQRDSFPDWLKYFARFVFTGRMELAWYLRRKKRSKILKQLLLGTAWFYTLIIGALIVDFQAALVVFIVPTAIAWFGLMAGNWTQHAFVDLSDPANPYKNSITVIDSLYNQRCFNDGYHIGHHLNPARHWTEMPQEFERNKKHYIENKSIVFRKIDYQMIWFLLMFRQYKLLAKFYVNLDSDRPMDHKEIEILLRSRVMPQAS